MLVCIALPLHIPNNYIVELIPTLLDQSETARKSKDWVKLEDISIKIFQAIHKGRLPDEDSLKKVVQNYLASLVGTGEFLTDLSQGNPEKYQNGLNKLLDFMAQKPHKFDSIDSIVNAAREISLLALNPVPANRNKIARYLREIARPDVSIIICKQIIEKTRLNYYSLTVICGAYCDLGEYDKAIDSAEIALKFQSAPGRTFALNALVRAHTLKFKATGDFSEIDKALSYGHDSIDLKLDSYAANAFISAAVASMYENEIEYAKEILAKAEPQIKAPDISAIFQAYKTAQALAPNSEVVEVIDEFHEEGEFGSFDSLFDLVGRDEGFTPDVQDLRKMKDRFNQDGWFLQGLCNVPCPKCGTIALHSYRKHFKRYGRDMHYWALVCDFCKTASDSIDYDKKEFTFISGDLEDNFPIIELCNVCNGLPI
jgi:tetratricopeptide (TPR) repeat protein